MGYADLAGNARLSFDQVFIETRGADNPFREKRETRSLFAPRATRVLRILLQGPLRPWKVTELSESARVSLGWVSAVRQQLLAREWAAGASGGLRVTKPGAVLDAWAKADDWEKRTRVQEYSLLLSRDPLSGRLTRRGAGGGVAKAAGLWGRVGMSKFGRFGDYPKESTLSAEAALLTAWRSLER